MQAQNEKFLTFLVRHLNDIDLALFCIYWILTYHPFLLQLLLLIIALNYSFHSFTFIFNVRRSFLSAAKLHPRSLQPGTQNRKTWIVFLPYLYWFPPVPC